MIPLDIVMFICEILRMRLYTTLKSIRQKLRINLKRKLNESDQIVVESTSQVSLIPSVRNTTLFMRGRLPIHPSQMGLPSGKTVL